MQPFGLVHGDLSVPINIRNDQLGDLCWLFPHQFACPIHIVSTRPCRPVIIQAQRQLPLLRKFLAALPNVQHSIPDRSPHIHGDLRAGKIIVIKMLLDRNQKIFAHPERALLV